MLESLERQRARMAWDFIRNEVKGQDYEKEYSAYVRRASALILANGLGNVLAFWKAKGGKAYDRLYGHINRWFTERHPTEKDVFNWILSPNTSSLEVFEETREVVALLNWMARFAEAELKE